MTKIFEHKSDNLNGFTILVAQSLEEMHQKIEEVLNDPTISVIVHCPLVIPVGGTRSYYKNTPIAIRFWKCSNFAFMVKEPRYDTALKLVRK